MTAGAKGAPVLHRLQVAALVKRVADLEAALREVRAAVHEAPTSSDVAHARRVIDAALADEGG